MGHFLEEGEMQLLEGLEYKKTVYYKQFPYDELVKVIRSDTPWLIIRVTKAAGQGGGFNSDIYSFDKPISSDELESLITEPDTREELLLFNCCGSWADQSLQSQLTGEEVILRR